MDPMERERLLYKLEVEDTAEMKPDDLEKFFLSQKKKDILAVWDAPLLPAKDEWEEGQRLANIEKIAGWKEVFEQEVDPLH
jgi:hypothetical protein